MRAMICGLLMGSVAGAALGAQPARPGQGDRVPGVEHLLAHTGVLQLTDAQVTRLAAIARRAEARRQGMRAAMDSAATRFGPGAPMDTAARRQFAQRMRTQAEQMRQQQLADRRDAIAILNADQQARAWETISRRGAERGMRRGERGRGMRGERRGGMKGEMRGGMRGEMRGRHRMEMRPPGMRPEEGRRMPRDQRQPGQPGQPGVSPA